jgi:hypothetical protein
MGDRLNRFGTARGEVVFDTFDEKGSLSAPPLLLEHDRFHCGFLKSTLKSRFFNGGGRLIGHLLGTRLAEGELETELFRLAMVLSNPEPGECEALSQLVMFSRCRLVSLPREGASPARLGCSFTQPTFLRTPSSLLALEQIVADDLVRNHLL